MAKRARELLTRRFWWQALFLVLVNPVGLLSQKWLCLPVFNCHSCPWAFTACPIGTIGKFAAVALVPVLVIGTIGVFAVVAGRIYCGWVCPFGFLQDIVSRVPLRKISLPRAFRFGKYAVLVGLVVVVPYLWTEKSDWFFCRLCPMGTLEGAIPVKVREWVSGPPAGDKVAANGGETLEAPLDESASPVPGLRYIVLVGLLVWMAFTVRPFCRYLCPLGATLALFNKISLWRMGVDKERCTQCGRCGRECLMDIALYRDPGSAECVRCLECKSCEAISSKWG